MATGNNGGSKNLKPWQPGQSGNPKGRPKGIARQLREAIHDDPTVITDVFLKIVYDDDAKDSDRIAAGREYLDRAFGKAPTHEPVAGGDPLELQGVDADIGAVVDELARKREAPPVGEPANGALADTG